MKDISKTDNCVFESSSENKEKIKEKERFKDNIEESEENKNQQKPILNSFKKFLTKFTPKEQMEMSIITLVGMMAMLIITTIYLTFFQDFSTFFKFLIFINGLFGVGFLFSMLLTTYSQYIALLTVGNAQEMMKGLEEIGELVT